eukprot:9497963-Pyramimonas_sp.AAC.1
MPLLSSSSPAPSAPLRTGPPASCDMERSLISPFAIIADTNSRGSKAKSPKMCRAEIAAGKGGQG